MDVEELAMIFILCILNDDKNKVNYALSPAVSGWAAQAQKGRALSKPRQAIRSHRRKERFHHCPQLDRHFISFLFPHSWSLKYKPDGTETSNFWSGSFNQYVVVVEQEIGLVFVSGSWGWAPKTLWISWVMGYPLQFIMSRFQPHLSHPH